MTSRFRYTWNGVRLKIHVWAMRSRWRVSGKGDSRFGFNSIVMRKLFFFLVMLSNVALILFQASCHDDDHKPGFCSEEGIIIGEDDRICGCCGGWFIEIGGETWRALSLPESFIEELDPDELPLPVCLEWSASIGPCEGEEIVVSSIRRR
jgi:hypothetical protein